VSAPLLVQIEWVDSRQPTASWQRVADLGYLAKCRYTSVGFLLREDERAKVLAVSIADEGDERQATGVLVTGRQAADLRNNYCLNMAGENAKGRKRRCKVKPDNPAQSRCFVEAARALGADADGETFNRVMDALLEPKGKTRTGSN
jgi:hypothetical protein